MDVEFTKQEEGVANLLTRYGFSNKEMAYRLGVAETTIKMHILSISRKIEEKTGIKNINRVKIVLYMMNKLEVPPYA